MLASRAVISAAAMAEQAESFEDLVAHAGVKLNWNLVDAGQVKVLHVVDDHLEDEHTDGLAEQRPSVLRRLEERGEDVDRQMEPVHHVVVRVLEQALVIVLLKDGDLEFRKAVHDAELEPRGFVEREYHVRDQHFHRQHPAVEHRENEQSERGLRPAPEAPSLRRERRL